MSIKHNPEFTTIELYQAYANVDDMMDLCENIFYHCAKMLHGTGQISYQGTPVDLTPPWQRLSMLDAVRQFTGADFSECNDEQANEIAKGNGMDVPKNRPAASCFMRVSNSLWRTSPQVHVNTQAIRSRYRRWPREAGTPWLTSASSFHHRPRDANASRN
jgi:lysyl-tRNA synthetase class II